MEWMLKVLGRIGICVGTIIVTLFVLFITCWLFKFSFLWLLISIPVDGIIIIFLIKKWIKEDDY